MSIIKILLIGSLLVLAGCSNDNALPSDASQLIAVGTPDSTFGTSGVVTDDGDGNTDEAFDVVTDSDGNVYVTGYITDSANNEDMAIWKYDNNGNFVSTFGTGGIVQQDNTIGGTDARGRGIALDSSGNVYVAGHAHNGSNPDMLIWKYDSNGALDSTFGTAGIVTGLSAAGGSYEEGRAIVLDSTGNIYVTGYADNGTYGDMAIWKYSSSGVADSTFDSDGLVVHNNAAGGNGWDYGEDIKLDDSDNIFVAGYSYGSTSNNYMTIWKYDSSGTLDGTFGTGGIVADSAQITDLGFGIALDDSGNIYVAGASHNGTSNDMILKKYTSSGVLNTSFSDDGIIIEHIDDEWAMDVAIDIAGNVYVVGAGSDLNDIKLWRYDSNGSASTAFGTNGVITYDGGSIERGNAMTIDRWGYLYVTGNQSEDIVLLKYE